MLKDQVRIQVTHPTGAGIPCSQPVRMGVPFQQGRVRSEQEIGVQSTCGDNVSTQIKSLARWPDGSIRWVLVEFWWQPTFDYEVVVFEPSNMPIDPKHGRHWIPHSLNQCLHLISSDEKQIATKVPLTIRLRIHERGEFLGRVVALELIDRGPVRFSWTSKVTFASASTTSPLVGDLTIHSFANSSVVEFEFCVRNPQAMDHPGGNWDLGAKGSILIEELSIDVEHAQEPNTQVVKASVQAEPGGEIVSATNELRIVQSSSGGENWDSRNHVDRNGNVPMPFCGYEIVADGKARRGKRAQPKVSIESNGLRFSAAYREFWQNFPKSISANSKTLCIGLFPKDGGYPHELQGGEQKTHVFALEIVHANEPFSIEPSTIDWYLRPVHLSLMPDEYAKREALPYLTPRNQSSDSRYESLVDLAIEGSDTFEVKREKIDEYGWRNFGDIYGDHEAVFHDGPTPLISHYNNQYDCTAGFACQYLRTGDVRWFEQMVAMADHAWDIDTYHTAEDKLLYNGGLFWHTYHYADADTATHRSYPRRLLKTDKLHKGQDLAELGETGRKLAKIYAIGGGPAAAHNYSTGWMHAYWLTGNERYRTAAINAADYVMRIEDGRQTPFRWFSRSDTGYSTCSSDGYYGPGRSAANSTLALLTGHELTGDELYLERAIQLMRRTVHPRQNLESLDLLNAELRWFYTMYLQALCRMVDYLDLIGGYDEDRQYGVAALLHYANWMALNECLTLSRPELLQYPTETWAAQDMRKWQVLEHTSRYEADSIRQTSMREKADYFFNSICDTLAASATKSLCRPVVLILNFGWQLEWYMSNRHVKSEQSHSFYNTSPFRPFVAQRTLAIQRFKQIALCGLLGSIFLLAVAAYFLLTWLMQKAFT